MAKVVYLCGNCSAAIRRPEDGVLIAGNIYLADPKDKDGLVGNAFPSPVNGKIVAEEIKEFAFCKKCFSELMPWNKKAPAPATPPTGDK